MRLLSTIVVLTVGHLVSGDDKPSTEPVKIGPATYSVPTAWERQRARPPRTMQLGIPLAEGDAGKCEFVVFYFNGGGGGVQENIRRWIGMFEKVDGKEKTESFTTGKLKITTLDVAGTYKDKPFPMAEEFTLRENYRMLAAIVETPDDGPYFFRIVGPKKTVSQQLDAWNQLLRTAKLDG